MVLSLATNNGGHIYVHRVTSMHEGGNDDDTKTVPIYSPAANSAKLTGKFQCYTTLDGIFSHPNQSVPLNGRARYIRQSSCS